MIRHRQSGFTLVEIILVMALAGLLLAIALAGQAQLRDHAEFDGAMEKLVSSENDARNQATSGVNIKGTGNGSITCSGGGEYVFAGVAWTVDDTMPNSAAKLDFYEAGPIDPDTRKLAGGATACVFDTEKVNLGASNLSVTSALVGSSNGGRMLFVRGNDGALMVCPANLTNPAAVFALTAACTSGKQSISLRDTRGDTGQVDVDGSGLATRVK